MSACRTPKPLLPGDVVAILSPAGAIDPCYIEGAAKLLAAWGYTPYCMQHAAGQSGRFSGTDTERLSDLKEAMLRPEIKAILCARGGYGAIRLLEHIPLEWIQSHPKWLIGYSDITALHALWSKAGVASLHAPMARHLREYPTNAASEMLREFLRGETPSYTIPPHRLNRAGNCEGILAGGNLSVLYGLRGTSFDFDPRGKLLFIEDIGERAYHIERMLYNLKLGGVLEKIAGLMVGAFTDCAEDSGLGRTHYEMIADLTASYSYPVLFDFPIGHTPQNSPVPIGCRASLTVNSQGGSLLLSTFNNNDTL